MIKIKNKNQSIEHNQKNGIGEDITHFVLEYIKIEVVFDGCRSWGWWLAAYGGGGRWLPWSPKGG